MNTTAPPLYLRELCPEVREEMCRYLDEDRAWEALVRKLVDMKFNITTLEELERTASPADKLFDILMNYRFKDGPLKIATFYKISAKLKLYKLMSCLAPHVNNDIIKTVDDAMKRSSVRESPESIVGLKNNTVVYLHQLPEDKRKELCAVLNHNEQWRFLMAKFQDAGFSHNDIQLCEITSPSNPSSEVFKLLADRNFKISLLYAALASMSLPAAMNILQCYVAENLIKDVQPNSQRHEFRKNVSVNIKQCENKDALDDSFKEKIQNIEKLDCFILRGISYKGLSDMTNRWSDKNRLGSNGKGNFYRGQLDGKEVAVKRLLVKDEEQRLKVLQDLHQLEDFGKKLEGHKNVLKMLMLIEGDGDNNPCIIYPFKKRKSLYDHLLNKGFSTSLDGPTSCWEQKQIIALGVTKALIYLQGCFGQQIVTVKSSDVILDDTMEPLVADVCLPSMLDRNRSEYLAMYLPKQEGQERKCFCLGTIFLELATENPADRFDMHPEQLNGREKIIMDTGVSKKISAKWKALLLWCMREETTVADLPKVQKVLEGMGQFSN